jgi:tetratricopeptide (TPR) repeat protein
MVPYPRNIHFSGRDDLLQDLRRKLNENEPGRYNHRVAIFGMGGIGKTQTALEYVYSSRDSGLYSRIYWLSAKDQGSLMSGYQSIAWNVRLATDAADSSQAARAVLAWLKQEDDWLIVLDNLDDITIANGLLPETTPRKHLLITTRNPNTDGIPAEGLEVSLLSLDDAQRLLIRLSKVTPSDSEQPLVSTIANDLGRLPLALDQAGSYIRYIARNYTTFHDQYQKNHREILSWVPKVNRAYSHSVATTWSLSFSALNHVFQMSAKLLRLLSFLNPDVISTRFLTEGAAALHHDLAQLVRTPIEFQKAITELERFSLVKVRPADNMVTIHRLVQTMVRDEMSESDLFDYAEMIIDLCYFLFPRQQTPFTDEMRRHCRFYQGQIMAPIQLIYSLWPMMTGRYGKAQQKGGFFQRVSGKRVDQWMNKYFRKKTRGAVQWVDKYFWTCSRFDFFLDHIGDYRDQETLAQRVLELALQTFPKDNDYTLIAMTNLAGAYQRLGRAEDAMELYEEVLREFTKARGEYDSHIINIMDRLASEYRGAGRFNEAIKLQERALKGSIEIWGEDGEMTVAFRRSLGILHCDSGNLEEGMEILEPLLISAKEKFGEDHDVTVTCMTEIARVYAQEGMMEKALEMQEKGLQMTRLQFGNDHALTLVAESTLAIIYRDMGRLDESLKLMP